MKRISLALFLTSFILFILSSCKKINESTELGGELIPAVDNVTTFDTTINVESFNELFSPTEDSTRSRSEDEQFIGYISNDPLFGKTTAAMFFELKPAPNSYRFSFPATKDSLYLDSIVLVLGYAERFGDSTLLQRVNVYEIAESSNFKNDSAYLIRSNPLTTNGSLGTTTFTPQSLDDSIFPFREKSKNQLRIKLQNGFGERLLQYDSTNAYRSDSAFRTYFKGFAVYPDSTFPGNSLVGISLGDTNTKLAIYYKYDKGGKRDTGITFFRFTGLSASANLIRRNYSSSQLANSLGGSAPDNLLYIQNAPGSYARIKVPGLSSISNRIIHRAELIAQQVFDPSDRLFASPPFLYLDAFDTAKSKYRSVPFDVSFTNAGELNAVEYGMLGKQETDGNGNSVRTWRFNISRYLQHVVNRTEPAYEFRLHAPFTVAQLFRVGTTDSQQFFSVNPAPVKGRVRLGGGNHPTQPMRLRIIYSRI